MINQNNISISVVIPIFNEEENIPELYKRLTSVLVDMSESYEIIFIDDGSTDLSCKKIKELIEHDACLLLISLSRNFGHQVAVSAGIDHAYGEMVIVMDADLQDPPEILPDLIRKLKEGYDVVYAIRRNRKENFLLRFCFSLFYRVMKKVSYIDIPLDTGDFCIMNRRVVELLQNMKERNRFIRGIRSWVGFKQTGFQYERDKRSAGATKYSFRKRLKFAFDGLVSFSFVPLKLASVLGFIVSGVSFVAIFIYLYIKLFTDIPMPRGFSAMIITILFLGGVQLITIGIMGEYLGRIYDEVKQRPYYIVKETIRKKPLNT